jgi:DNA-binding Xre family transcriptional regulator
MQMMELPEVVKLLRDRRLSVVSDATGVNRNTLRLLRDGRQESIRYETLKALSDYFSPQKDA